MEEGGDKVRLGRTKGVRHQAQGWSGSLAEGRRENLEKGERKKKWWERRWEGRKPLTQAAFIQGYEVASYPSLLLI